MGKRLYVGNLSFQTTEGTLQTLFAQDGRQVASVSIMMDRDTGRSRGFAFVEMNTDQDAQAAIKAVDGKQVDGRALRVNEAEERKPRTGGGGGGGRRERW
ncbi:MAG: RNA-binding protein [Planctomycetes bacterium]|nr:RNA-binding protein [Planctomycetota bacterium]